MKKITFLTLLISIILPFTLFSQDYTHEIQTMLTTVDDPDFTTFANLDGTATRSYYFVADDTLYETVYTMIALSDIDFDITDVTQSLLSKMDGNYPYVLSIHPKPDSYSVFLGMKLTSPIQLYLPNEQYALQTFAYLKKLAAGHATEEPKTEHLSDEEAHAICQSTALFLNDLMKSNLVDYIDEPTSTDATFITYWSKITFPHAIKTFIVDTNMFEQYFRSAQIIFREENRETTAISDEMLAQYKELSALLKLCLDYNAFEFTNKDDSPDILYKMESEYKKLQPVDPNQLFADLQTPHGFVVQLVVIQNQNTDGSYNNVLQLNLKEQ